MQGGDLEATLSAAPERHLDLAEVLRFGAEAAEGLAGAHGNGIIHRDLKPGNIWISQDGTAKLGDFGLAFASSETRMTTEGTMLGTVAYMPPEQALGNDATPRSDLYAPGCVLYELVTGHPPFGGDDAVAVISQHLNTAPVAPSWHREDCPPPH
jgi:serine/threonine protein kinase